MELRQQINQNQSELDQVKQENTTLHILNAQQLKDMESMRNKYARIEKENCSLKEENTVLLSRMKVLEAENQQLRRMVFGQSTEKMDTAGQDDSNTTELPEETMCSTDKDKKETDMAGGHPGDEPHSGDTFKGESCPPRQPGSGCGEKKPRPNNIRRRMEEKLPTVHRYPMSAQLIQKLDELYGKEQWRIMNWEGAQHLVHIPEIYVNRLIMCLSSA